MAEKKVFCVECGDVPAAMTCDDCAGDPYCGLCWTYLHKKGTRAKHNKRLLVGVDMAQHLDPQFREGTTEHFAALQKARALRTSTGTASARSAADDDDDDDEAQASMREIEELARWVPMRLTERERALLLLLEGALEISSYTDRVDVSFDYYGWRTGGVDKQRIIDTEIEEILRLICGLFVAGDYQGGKKALENALQDNASFFQCVFEIGRRFKIMNPDKMRTTYGKLMHILQDCALVKSPSCPFDAVVPIVTVRSFLEERGAVSLLSDANVVRATRSIVQGTRTREQVDADIAAKTAAQAALVARFAPPKQADPDAPAPPMTEDDLRRALDSLADANAYLAANRDPVDRVIGLLKQYFPKEETDELHNLSIQSGFNGSYLSHSHSVQWEFVHQSLKLWRSVEHQMFMLWFQADRDLLVDGGGYRLWNTGQGLNRMQSAPNVSRAMHNILGSVQSSIERGWIGLSVVHLGDRDVPNAMFFIDKYTQIPRILVPLARAVERVDVIAASEDAKLLVDLCGGAEYCKTFILRDFFQHGFDGSGSDGGSCVDGRLTSCWNWCSKIEKKQYYPLLLATGFEGFDGSFR